MGPTGLIPLGGVLQSAAAWMETTWLHHFATNYKWVWATMETLHFLGMGLLIGTVGVLDLRLIGVAKELPIESTQRLVPWGVAAFVLTSLTGIVFLAGAPYQYLYNFAFQMKVLFMLCRGHQRHAVLPRRRVAESADGRRRRVRARGGMAGRGDLAVPVDRRHVLGPHADVLSPAVRRPSEIKYAPERPVLFADQLRDRAPSSNSRGSRRLDWVSHSRASSELRSCCVCNCRRRTVS